MPRPARIVEYRIGGFDPRFRRWLMLLYREPAVHASDRPLARATLDVREDPDCPGHLLVTVTGAARVTHDGLVVGPPPRAAPSPAALASLSAALHESSERRRCPSCGRGGGLASRREGGWRCRWCAFVVAGCAA